MNKLTIPMLGALCLLSSGGAAQEMTTLGGKKIVGGESTTVKEHPWQAAIIAMRSDGDFLCGGSVIAENWILTAAHCFGADGNAATAKAKVNVTNYVDEGSWLSTSEIIVSEAYNSVTHEHDIALVRVDSTQPGSVVPLAVDETPLAMGEDLVVTGWGATSENGPDSPTLLKATIPYIDNQTCNAPESYNGKITSTMLCAGNPGGGEDSCQGDSGGPLVKGTKPEEAILVGIVSFGEGCARKLKYGVYTRVSKERDWIRSALAKSEQ